MTIIVTGTRWGTQYLDLWSLNPAVSGAFGGFSLAGGTIGAVVGSGSNDFSIPAQSGKPAITAKNLNSRELAYVLAAIDNSAAYEEWDKTVQEMAANGIELSVTKQNTIASWEANLNASASIRFYVAPSAPGAPQSLQPNTTVEIVVYGNKIGGGDQTFAHLLTHEMAHATRDSSGRFHTNEIVIEDLDGDLYNAVFKNFREENYISSVDVVTAPNQHGFIDFVGTTGNNLLEDNNAEHNFFYTKEGNDLIFSGGGTDRVQVDGLGKKLIYDSGGSFDVLGAVMIPSMAHVVMSKIGADAYITSSLSTFSPFEDPNAIVLLNWYGQHGAGHIELLNVGSGEVTHLWNLAGDRYASSAMESNASTSSSLYVRGMVWDMPDQTDDRYLGVDSYEAFSFVDGLIFEQMDQVAPEEVFVFEQISSPSRSEIIGSLVHGEHIA